MRTLEVGARAPEFALMGLDGKPYALSHRLTLAIFFKTTCPTCQYAWQFYERLHQAYKQANFALWGISQHDAERTRAFVQKYGATFPTLLDEDLEVSRQYEPQFVPTGFLIDAERNIVETFASWQRDALNAFSARLAERLGVPPQLIVKPEDNAAAFKAG